MLISEGALPSKINVPQPTQAPTLPLISNKLQISAKLLGTEYVSTAFNISTCTDLLSVSVTVDFKNDGSPDSWPFNIELTLVNPSGKGVAIGGVDVSVQKARIITEWPDTWMTKKNGTYSTTLGVKDADLHGVGQWTLYMMNSWSVSKIVSYNMTVVLSFDSNPEEISRCQAELVNPLPVPTAQPTSSGTDRPPLAIKNPENPEYISRELKFHSVELGVEEGAHGNVIPDRFYLAKFEQYGVLDSIILNIDAWQDDFSTWGTDVYLLTVIITSPSGMIAQIGGFEWFSRDDRFYARR